MSMAVNFIEKVYTFTGEKALFSAPCHVLVGVSGGADSMALLHVLTHWPVAGLQVSAVHIHHGLRGKHADNDEAFVRQYCENNGVDLIVYHEDVSALANAEGLTIEEAGRKIRYGDFEVCRQSIGADYILTAHTASDQAETVLMRIIRGTGVDGLVGIPVAHGTVRRPLLSCSRNEIEAYCRDYGIAYVTDETNADMRFTRNRIRHEIIPLLQQINPAVDEALARLSSHAFEDATFIRQYVDKAHTINVVGLNELPKPVLSRVVTDLLMENGVVSYDQYHIQSIRALIGKGHGSVCLPGGVSAVITSNELLFKSTATNTTEAFEPIPVSSFPYSFTINGQAYRITLDTHAKNVHSLFSTNVLDYDKIQGKLCVRSRREGDTIHPAGRGVGKSLKKLMNEYKIPVSHRDNYPLLCDEQGVVLIPGHTCDERVRVTEDTKHFLVWQEPAE